MAKMDKTEVAKQLLSLFLGMGFGGGSAGGAAIASLASGVGSGAGSTARLPPGAASFVASNFPEEFSPKWYHGFNVVHIPGKANLNQHGKANAGTIAEAGRMQSIDEHNNAILKYVRPGMDPKTMRAALHRGLEEEKNLAAYWNESESRRPFSVSSSAVTGIRLTPDARIEVQWKGKPTWYTFKEYPNTYKASLAAQELLQSDSIGRAVYPVVSKKMNKPNPLLGGWNRSNYDGAYA